MSRTAYAALDIGGTKIAAAVVDGEGQVLCTARVPTPAGAAEELFAAAVFAVEAVLSQQDVSPGALGVGCGGPMTWPSGAVSPLNIPGWRGFPLRDRLEQRFGVPVRVHNDAVCLTVGEHLVGAGRSADNVLGMVVSTGVGGGLVLDGRLISGATGNAGHIGHLVVDPGGPACECGGRGCLEAVARGPALVAWAAGRGWTAPEATGVALAASARSGDPVALAAFQRAGRAVGVAVASAAALLDLQVAVIGGGLSLAGELLMPWVYKAFEEHAGLEFAAQCRIALAREESGLVGAAALFLAGDRYWPPDA